MNALYKYYFIKTEFTISQCLRDLTNVSHSHYHFFLIARNIAHHQSVTAKMQKITPLLR